MSDVYRSPYEAYPFLSDPSDDLRCDFEILTDEIASGTGLLRAHLIEYVRKNTLKDSGENLKNTNESCHNESDGIPEEPNGICEQLNWICEIIYHINPTLRTRFTITNEECIHLTNIVNRLQEQVKNRCEKFVLPTGGALACEAHLLRVKAKKLVRLIYRHTENGNEVPNLLLDVINLLSGYFFFLALYLNEVEKTDEIPFISRNYK